MSAGSERAGGGGWGAVNAWVEIDLDALERNYRELGRRVAPAGVLAVVKADAYGHGLAEVGRRLARAGVPWLGVGSAREGRELRRAGVERPVLVMGTARPEERRLYRELELTPTVSSLEQLEMWSAGRSSGERPVDLHLKVDTGMRRLGIEPQEVPAAVERIDAEPGLRLAGLLSHFAEADAPDSERNALQDAAFERVVAGLPEAVRAGLTVHMANSGAGLHLPRTRRHLVRFGLALYGHDPARREEGLEPVMAVRGRIVLLRDVEPGARAGYGGAWTAEGRRRLAVVPVGYGDGYPWRLSGRGEALVGGHRAPIAGRVSMDMTLLDVTGLDVAVGDPVVLLGRQGGEAIDAWELAERAGTIPWEIFCGFGLRLPRRHLGAGEGGDA